MKALPLAYNKDMQEDKEPLFDSAENIMLCIQAMTGMVLDFTADKTAMANAATSGYANATDLADWLVKELKMPFRNAHHTTAKLVKLATQKAKKLEELSLKDLQSIEPKIRQEIFSILSPKNSISSRKSFGGTAPENVKKATKIAQKKALK